jgi:DNA-binding MarR family transcriptional regulator
MSEKNIISLEDTVNSVLETLPPVWDRIRSNLRTAATSKFGITLDQFHTLRHIRKGFCHVGELAEKRQVSRSAISQSVEVLVSKGLVMREQESKDRRLVKLALSDFAGKVLDENFEENRVWMRGRMASLGPDNFSLVVEVMQILRQVFATDEV